MPLIMLTFCRHFLRRPDDLGTCGTRRRIRAAVSGPLCDHMNSFPWNTPALLSRSYKIPVIDVSNKDRREAKKSGQADQKLLRRFKGERLLQHPINTIVNVPSLDVPNTRLAGRLAGRQNQTSLRIFIPTSNRACASPQRAGRDNPNSRTESLLVRHPCPRHTHHAFSLARHKSLATAP